MMIIVKKYERNINPFESCNDFKGQSLIYKNMGIHNCINNKKVILSAI